MEKSDFSWQLRILRENYVDGSRAQKEVVFHLLDFIEFFCPATHVQTFGQKIHTSLPFLLNCDTPASFVNSIVLCFGRLGAFVGRRS